uniref:Uncharacterized protein n=1 Tax=Knipowitschia caucasica TaxID=637954 RepID=A0AAV2JP76_KNICA
MQTALCKWRRGEAGLGRRAVDASDTCCFFPVLLHFFVNICGLLWCFGGSGGVAVAWGGRFVGSAGLNGDQRNKDICGLLWCFGGSSGVAVAWGGSLRNQFVFQMLSSSTGATKVDHLRSILFRLGPERQEKDKRRQIGCQPGYIDPCL